MPYSMPLPERIGRNTSKTKERNTVTNNLGNNIRQHATVGLNSTRETQDIIYEDITEAQKDTIEAVLDAVLGGVDYINYAAPGEVSKKYVVMSYTTTNISGNLWTVSFQAVQEY